MKPSKAHKQRLFLLEYYHIATPELVNLMLIHLPDEDLIQLILYYFDLDAWKISMGLFIK